MAVKEDIQKARRQFDQENYSRAKRTCEKILREDPKQAEPWSIVGTIEMRRLRFAQAIPFFQKSLELDDKQAETWAHYGFSLYQLRHPKESLEAFEKSLALNDKQIEPLLVSSTILLSSGKNEEAKKRLKKILKIDKRRPQAYRLLAFLTDFKKDKSLLKNMEALAGKCEDLPPNEKAHLHFALARAFEKLGKNEKFHRHTEKANAFQRKLSPSWEVATRFMCEKSKEIFQPDLFKNLKKPKNPDFIPVFIVGIPRCGSTLAEQILASHKGVFGADELTYISSFLVDGASSFTGSEYPLKVTELTPEQIKIMGEKYRQKVHALAPDAEYICDKMLGNALYLGIICMTFPHAKVIHLRRHPYDTALSVYKNYFSPNVPYTCDLEGLGKYFKLHHSMMNHWKRVLPDDFILDIRYEDLVDDLKGYSRKMTDFLGLEWDEKCLEFYKTDRPVFTHSTSQVREKLTKSSIGKWKNHKKLLEPFIKEASGLLDDYGYPVS